MWTTVAKEHLPKQPSHRGRVEYPQVWSPTEPQGENHERLQPEDEAPAGIKIVTYLLQFSYNA